MPSPPPPNHIAIIMDGNGRWAKRQGLMRLLGHRAGVKTVRRIVEDCQRLGVGVLTLYAFSTENWNRPKEEVSGLMDLLKNFLRSELERMLKNGVRLQAIGQLQNLPTEVYEVLQETISKTAHCQGMVLNLALSYGGRSELLQAMQAISTKCVTGSIRPEDITEAMVDEHLYTAGLPEPDLLIRTGGEARLSNFLLWQSSYAEIFFTDTAWPDFNLKDLTGAISDYHGRQRRFGRTGEQVADDATTADVTVESTQ